MEPNFHYAAGISEVATTDTAECKKSSVLVVGINSGIWEEASEYNN